MKKLITLILIIAMNYTLSQAQVVIEHETYVSESHKSVDFSIKVNTENMVESVTIEKRHFDIASKEDKDIKASIQGKGLYSSVDLEYESGDSYRILVRIKNKKKR